jgi:uncharacterized protein
MDLDANGLEIISRQDCLRLLAGSCLGRVGLGSSTRPIVLPVRFRLSGDDIVFRTSPGSKLDAAVRNAVVAFEVDDFDPVHETGWSVLVTGMAREATDPADLAVLSAVPLRPWCPTQPDRLVRIATDVISGRRIPRWDLA